MFDHPVKRGTYSLWQSTRCTLYVGLWWFKSPRCYIHCRVAVGKFLQVHRTHSEKHIIVAGVICALVLVYQIIFVWDAYLLQVCVFSLGTDSLLHVKNQLESKAGNHLQKYIWCVNTKKGKKKRSFQPVLPIFPSLPCHLLYLSGGVANIVQTEQVSRVRHGVVLGDGDRKGNLKVLWVFIDGLWAAQASCFLGHDVPFYSGEKSESWKSISSYSNNGSRFRQTESVKAFQKVSNVIYLWCF